MRIWDEAGLVDRCGHQRHDKAWLAMQWQSPHAQLITLDERLNPCVTPEKTLVLRRTCGDYDQQHQLFLGTVAGSAYFAVVDGGTSAVALREAMAALPDHQVALVVEAVAVLQWQRRSTYCEQCGNRTTIAHGGFSRYCSVDQREIFPRHDRGSDR
ncbi:MAG: hypothetical protein ACRCWS_07780 [Propionibacteriaceae bacterium]